MFLSSLYGPPPYDWWHHSSQWITCTHPYRSGLLHWQSEISPVHDDVIKWKHLPSYRPFVRGIHRSPGNSRHKGQWRGTLMFSLIWARTNDWVNNWNTGDLRHNYAHYDIIQCHITNVALHHRNVTGTGAIRNFPSASEEILKNVYIYIYIYAHNLN